MGIRDARPSDAPALVGLLEQLGYPSTVEEIEVRMRAIAKTPSARAWVAEDGVVVGLATCHLLQSVHASPPTALMTTLVVDAGYRGRGVGQSLVRVVEDWAQSNGAVRISLTSGTQRDQAHAFYQRLGYERTGVRFTKTLTRRPGHEKP